MNEPIISPWIFYFIDLAGKFSFFLPILALVSGFICLTSASNIKSYNDKEENDRFAKAAKTFGVIFLMSIVTILLIPSQDTIYKMLTASYITPANIAKVSDTAENAAIKLSDMVVDAAKKLQEDKK